MLRFLRTPFPLQRDARTNALVALSLGGFAWAFLLFYQPFGIAALPTGTDKQGFLAGFGVGMALVYAVVTVGGPALWPRFFDEGTWTVGREIVKCAVLIGLLGIAFWGNAMGYGIARATLTDYAYFQGLTWAGSVLPVAGLTLWKLLVATRSRLNRAIPASTDLLVFQGASAVETLRVRRAAVWLLRAEDNYVEVIYRDESSFKKHILRATLKGFEAQLRSCPEFFRCHRSYLVNLGNVRRVSGALPTVRLELEDFPEPVPVARGFAKPLLSRLQADATGRVALSGMGADPFGTRRR